MAACVDAVQQGDGSLLLRLDPVATDLTACAYVVESGAEVGNSLLQLTPGDGAAYAGEVVGVWVAAYCIKAIVAVIKGSSENG